MMRTFRWTGHEYHSMRSTSSQAITKGNGRAINFGFVFGMGWSKFVEYARDSYDVVVSDSEAKEFRKRFFETYSKLQSWHERQRRLVRNYHRVQSAIGRVRHLPDIESGDEEIRKEAERQAINSPVQSLASDMMLLSMILLHAMMDPGEARIVGTVHSSIDVGPVVGRVLGVSSTWNNR
jgi:DNA polymerase-1